MQNDQTEYLTTRQTAEYLGVSRQWLEERRSDGSGPPVIKATDGRGGIVRYKKSEVDSWMLGRQRNFSNNPNPMTGKE